jgi:hypothetical protein
MMPVDVVTHPRYLDAVTVFVVLGVLAVLVPVIATSLRSGTGHPAPPEHPDRAGRRRTHRGAASARRRVQRPPR